MNFTREREAPNGRVGRLGLAARRVVAGAIGGLAAAAVALAAGVLLVRSS